MLSLIIVFLLIFTYVYYKRIYYYWKTRGIPHVPTRVSIDLILGRISLAEYVQGMYFKLKTFERIGGGYVIMNLPIFTPISLELIKSITVRDQQFFHSRGFYHTDSDPLSQHLVSLTGYRWKKSRRILSSELTSSKLKKFILKLKENINEMTEKIDEEESINCSDIISRWVMDNIISCIFGVGTECMKNPDSRIYSSGKNLSRQIFGNITYNFIAIVFTKIFEYFDLPLTHRTDRKFLLSFLKEIIDYRIKNRIKTEDFIDDFLHSLRNEDVGFDEFASMIFTFFIAGYVSTSTTMLYALYELSLNRDIQDNLRIEIEKYEKLDYNTVMNMTYLDQVVNETLRKYPVTPFLIRECSEPYEIPGTKNMLEKGTVVWISTFSLHRDPEYYPQPEKFKPERFSDESKNKRHPFSFIPFGDGLRNCIGQRFAFLQIKLGIVHLLKRYSLSLDPKTSDPLKYSSYSILLVPKDEIFIKFKQINNKK